MQDFQQALKRMEDAVKRLGSSTGPSKDSLVKFAEKRNTHLWTDFEAARKALVLFPGKSDLLTIKENNAVVKRVELLLKSLALESDPKGILLTLNRLKTEILLLESPRLPSTFSVKGIPSEVRLEMQADIEEVQRCYDARCYRASVILCGRLLETALHRKYYDATKNDLLEKSPGIGLGNLVAKLHEKNILLDPAIAQQIHLINQVRIYSVHTKKEVFTPSEEQAHAIILYTLDILKKLF